MHSQTAASGVPGGGASASERRGRHEVLVGRCAGTGHWVSPQRQPGCGQRVPRCPSGELPFHQSKRNCPGIFQWKLDAAQQISANSDSQITENIVNNERKYLIRIC